MNINFGKCPYCKTAVLKVRLEPIEIGSGPLGMDLPKYHGVSYCCSSCQFVLSVSIDPISLKTETISGVAQELRKGSGR